MRCGIPIFMLIAIAATSNGFTDIKLPKAVLKKLSQKAFKKFSSKLAGRLLKTSLRDGIGAKNHGGSWSLPWFEQKFEIIASTFEVLQKEVDHLAEISENTQNGFYANRTKNIIMKTVIFITLVALLGAIIFIGLKMRKNVYFKRLQNILSALAGYKSDLKNRANIQRTSDEVTRLQRRHRGLDDNISQVHHNSNDQIVVNT